MKEAKLKIAIRCMILQTAHSEKCKTMGTDNQREKLTTKGNKGNCGDGETILSLHPGDGYTIVSIYQNS